MYTRCCVAACCLVTLTGCATTHDRSGTKAPTYTWDQNPTTTGARGTPSLDDQMRPAAWVFVDDMPGTFTAVDGKAQLEWCIHTPVTPSPTFRLEVFEPLVGTPDMVNLVILPVSKRPGAASYAIAARDGALNVGTTYTLVEPGEGFVIRDTSRNPATIIERIPPLAPDTYLLAASIHNSEKGVATLAATKFTVREAN